MNALHMLAAVTVIAAATVQGTGADAAAAPTGEHPAACPWMNTRLSADQRATLLLDASTLDQKLRWLVEIPANNPARTTFAGGSASERGADGSVLSTTTSGTATYPAQLPCTPNVVYTDGPDYVRGAQGATMFPAQIGLAASWNAQFAYAKGQAQAADAFASGRNVVLGPGVSSSRTPLAGRTPEYLGEDSLLSGDLAAAGINGLQSSGTVMAVLKHYIGNEQEYARQYSDDQVDTRTLNEVYDLPFRIALSKSSPGGVMCSYNQVNSRYACENPLLTSMLKGQDGFKGYVVSDFFAVHSTADSLNAGLDQELHSPIFYSPATVKAALAQGQITQARIDDAAFRVVRSYIAAGLFDHPLPASPAASAATDATRAVAEKIAEQGTVLLKNQGGVLPLNASSGSIAVIGQTASATPTGGVSAATVCAEGSSSGFGSPACPNVVAPLDSLTARAAQDGVAVSYDNGADIASAVAAAKKAKVAVVFGYAKQGEGADRTDLGLDGNGDALISAVAAANPNTVVVLETGSATTMPWLDRVKGVVEAWYPGEQQGPALARLLFGDADFTGRLPMTFPRSLADTPTGASAARYPGVPVSTGNNKVEVAYGEGLAVGYKWYEAEDIAPLFPFGYGLSYSSFGYADLRVGGGGNGTGPVTVAFTVRNTGTTTATETPQVYLTLPAATGEPGHRLVGYRQVTLAPGEARRVVVHIDPDDAAHPLSYWNSRTGGWAIADGGYGVGVGPSSASMPLTGSFRIR